MNPNTIIATCLSFALYTSYSDLFKYDNNITRYIESNYQTERLKNLFKTNSEAYQEALNQQRDENTKLRQLERERFEQLEFIKKEKSKYDLFIPEAGYPNRFIRD